MDPGAVRWLWRGGRRRRRGCIREGRSRPSSRGHLTVAATEARARMVAEVGQAAVSAKTLACYREATGDIADTSDPVRSAAPLGQTRPPASAKSIELPRILVATGRDQALRLVAELPEGLRIRIMLVVPPATGHAPPDPDGSPPSVVRLIEAAPARYERPPSGRSPISRLKRATWRPPFTADEELAVAIRRAAAEVRRGRESLDLVALDAPGRCDCGRPRYAPGSSLRRARCAGWPTAGMPKVPSVALARTRGSDPGEPLDQLQVGHNGHFPVVSVPRDGETSIAQRAVRRRRLIENLGERARQIVRVCGSATAQLDLLEDRAHHLEVPADHDRCPGREALPELVRRREALVQGVRRDGG